MLQPGRPARNTLKLYKKKKKNGKEKSKLMMQIANFCIPYKNDPVFLSEQITKARVLTVLFLTIEPGEGTFW